MARYVLLILFILAFSSCNENFSFIPATPKNKSSSFKQGIYSLDHLFDSGTTYRVDSLTKDKQDNLYLYGTFNGYLDGVSSEVDDLFVIKLNPQFKTIWKIHFNSAQPLLNSTSMSEVAKTILWNESDGSIYISAMTKSEIVENNPTASYDLFYAKISESGVIQWVRHIGNSSSLDSTADESHGHTRIDQDGNLVVSYETSGNLYDTNAGGVDIGVLKLDPQNGNIIDAIQLGTNTLQSWATPLGLSPLADKNEKVTEANFDFDGDKIVLPFRTGSSLLETNPNTSSDIAYVVINKDFTIDTIVHIGQESYDVWKGSNFPSGTINGDNQARSVIVLGPKDYLFTGKSSLNLADVRSTTSSDVFTARFVNHQLHSLKQFGESVFPNGDLNEEVRHLYKGNNGYFYIHGHSKSAILGSDSTELSPFIMQIDESGKFISGLKLQQSMITNNIVTLRHENISNEIVVTDQQFILTINHAPTGTALTKSFLWVLEKF